MKTTTVRLDDDQVAMLELIAKRKGCRPSDVLRAALRDHIDHNAAHDKEIEEAQLSLARERMANSAAEIRNTLGAASLPDFDPPVAQKR